VEILFPFSDLPQQGGQIDQMVRDHVNDLTSPLHFPRQATAPDDNTVRRWR
jgi:hypothetical protein